MPSRAGSMRSANGLKGATTVGYVPAQVTLCGYGAAADERKKSMTFTRPLKKTSELTLLPCSPVGVC